MTPSQLKKLRNTADEMRAAESTPRTKKRVQLLTAALLLDGETLPPNFTSMEHLKCVVDAFNELTNKDRMRAFLKSPLYEEHGQNRKGDDILLSEL